jgi:hypothetical protein
MAIAVTGNTSTLAGGMSTRFLRGRVETLTDVRTLDFTGAEADLGATFEALRDALPSTGASLSLGAYGTVRLEDVDITVTRDGAATASLTYRRWDTDVIEVRGSAGLEEVETQVDADGNDIVVTHDGETQVATMRKKLITASLTVVYVVAANDPEVALLPYYGRLNDAPWRQGQAREWLVAGVEYDPIDTQSDPNWYRVTVRFAFKEGGWDEDAAFRDPETGRPPEGLVAGTGYLEGVELLGEEDFTVFLSAS